MGDSLRRGEDVIAARGGGKGGLNANAGAVGIVNAVFVFATFLMTLPGIITPARSWIKIGAYMTVVCAIFSLIIGLDLWVLTLRTKENFQPVWNNQPASTQDLMQTAVCSPPPFLL